MSLFKKIAAFLGKKNGIRPPEIDTGEEGTDGAGSRATENASGIVRFSYSYNGSIGGNSYTYKIDARTRPVRMKLEHMLYPEYGEPEGEVGDDFLKLLEGLCRRCGIASWNGFNKYNKYVCDGSGFSLSIQYADGKVLTAHGSNSFPKGYREFKNALDALFDPEVEKIHGRERQKIIDRGLEGALDSMLVTFIQKGRSGSDRYEALITKKGVRSNNFDVKIKSVSGEFLPAGEYRIYKEVEDEDIDFPAFEEIVRRHGLIRWFNYDKAAEDYNNSEWFQLSLGFEKEYLNAHGTEHPEGYDGFRKEFLELLVKTALKVAEKYPDPEE
ncbi:MAG: hypothetical protein J6X34_05420 [Clostridia bacterium]|nr:hypothetical protein [Clostridia bacterium]